MPEDNATDTKQPLAPLPILSEVSPRVVAQRRRLRWALGIMLLGAASWYAGVQLKGHVAEVWHFLLLILGLLVALTAYGNYIIDLGEMKGVTFGIRWVTGLGCSVALYVLSLIRNMHAQAALGTLYPVIGGFLLLVVVSVPVVLNLLPDKMDTRA